MTPLAHIAASGAISLLSIAYFKSIGYAAVSFLAGVLVDFDHFIDYYLNHGFTFDIRKIYNCCLALDLNKVYVVLHSYQLIAFLWASIYIFSLSKFWQAIALGLTQHMIFDQATNPISVFGYFFIYRAVNGFKKGRVIATQKGQDIGSIKR